MEPEFWSSLMCDLGLMYNTLGRHLLDRPPLSKLTPVEVRPPVSLIEILPCNPLERGSGVSDIRFLVVLNLHVETRPCACMSSMMQHDSCIEIHKHQEQTLPLCHFGLSVSEHG